MRRREFLTLIGAASVGAALPARSRAAAAATELGVLTPFYRGIQLQGQLTGQGLIEIPDYLVADDVDLKYRKRAGAAQEVPFVDTFSINRFLGGYREDWLRKANVWDGELGLRSLDYVIRKSDGSLQFRPELIERRLRPYLDAGYRPEDMTICLENIPWDLARNGGAMGAWGQREPAADLAAWQDVVSHFAADLQRLLGPAVSAMHFKTGTEYDEKASFDGAAQDFFAYYAATDAGLHRVLPAAKLGPGEFTGVGTCATGLSCVYDTRDFLGFAAAHNLGLTSVPRSLNSFLDKSNILPSQTVNRAVTSYARLPAVTREIFQFGILDETFGAQDGSDPAALQANWEFQTLIGLWQSLKPARVFHWGGVVTMGRVSLLNGSGFLRLVLDRYLGYRALRLTDIRDPASSPNTEVAAVAFATGAFSALVISSCCTNPSGARRAVTVEIPSSLSEASAAPKSLRYRGSDNVFSAVRDDLAKDGNLKAAFQSRPLSFATPVAMAEDIDRARVMVSHQAARYVNIIKRDLRWNAPPNGISRDGTTLRCDLEENELVLIEW